MALRVQINFYIFGIACIKLIFINIIIYNLESELVSGFMTEHAASIFVFFFLAEYASILLMSILTTILFLGGYSCPITPFIILENILNIILSFI